MLTIAARTALTPDGWAGPTSITIGPDGLIVALDEAHGVIPDTSLVPGFVDLQVNGVDDIDVAVASGSDWSRIGNRLLDQGVTSWCPTLVTAPLTSYEQPLLRIAQARQLDGPCILGAHLEGPFLGGAPGAHPRELLAPIDLDWLAALPDVVRLVTLAPELDLAVEAIELLVGRGIVVSLGHSTPSLDEMAAAVTAGARMTTHLFNGMSGVHHRSPGLAGFALVEDCLSVGIIADLVHVHPLMLELAFRAKPNDRTVLVTDAVAWRARSAGAVGIEVRDGAPRLANGTLAGSTLTMDQAIRNLVDHCAVSLEQAVYSASTNPARLLGCADRGTIEVGQRADLVALDHRLQIAGVWLAGAQVR